MECITLEIEFYKEGSSYAAYISNDGSAIPSIKCNNAELLAERVKKYIVNTLKDLE